MPREAVLQKQDVIEAMDYFRSQGVPKPGQLRLIRYLRDIGKQGSIPVLKDYLVELAQEAAVLEQHQALRERTPQNVIQSAKHLYESFEIELTKQRETIFAEADELVNEAQGSQQAAEFALSEQRSIVEQTLIQNEHLAMQLQEKDKHLATQQIEFEKQVRAIATLEVQLAECERTISMQDSNLLDLRKQLASQAKDYAKRETHLMSEAEALKAEHVRQIRSLENEKEVLREQHANAGRDLMAQKTYLKNIITEKAELTQKLHGDKLHLQEKLSALEKQFNDMKSLDSLVTSIKKIQSDIDGTQKEQKAIRKQLQGLPALFETLAERQYERLHNDEEK